MCTSFQLHAEDSSIVVGRTMEFPIELPWDLIVVPPGRQQQSSAPTGAGHSWTGRYGYAGISIGESRLPSGAIAPAQESVSDGVNEAGLTAGLLYLPGYTQYQSPEGVPNERLLAPVDMASFVLATCATVAEAREAIASVVVWPQETPLGVMPMHLVLNDRSGASAVIEWIAGEAVQHDNPVGVVTNSPPFDWHLANLRNYVNLSATGAAPIDTGQLRITALGEGSGMLGLPGDFTPTSRFVRATALTLSANKTPNSRSAANTALHILGSFDIPKGAIRDTPPSEVPADMPYGDFTDWSIVAELGDPVAYTIKTYDDPTPRRLVLAEALQGPVPPRRPITGVRELDPLVLA